MEYVNNGSYGGACRGNWSERLQRKQGIKSSAAMVSDAIPFASLHRALVIKLRHHGDVLLSSPVFSALKYHAPNLEVDALVYGDTAPMLDGHPAIAQVHRIDRNWKRQGWLPQVRAEWGLLSTLRSRRYDLVIHLTEHRRGAWLTRLIGPRWSVAPRQNSKFWTKSFSHFYPRSNHPLRHTVESNLDALRRLGLQLSSEDKRLTLIPGPVAENRVAQLLAQYQLLGNGFVHCHPASRWQFKCWPADKVAQMLDALSLRGLPVVLTAAAEPQERQLIDAIKAAARSPLIDLAGQLNLKELAALTARAHLFVGVDSAPMHIAAAMGTPTVAIFGPSGDIEWAPWGVPHRIVASDAHPCRPCGLDGCGGGKISECLTTLPVDRVLAACDQLL
jgi:heptosyltransferase III